MTASASLDLGMLWEFAKNVMLPAIFAGVGWIVKKLNAIEARQVAIEVRQVNHEHILVGVGGQNGIKSDVSLLKRRVGAIENRNIAIDAIDEAERQMHPGPNRRHESRRLRDQIHEAHDTDEHTTEGHDA